MMNLFTNIKNKAKAKASSATEKLREKNRKLISAYLLVASKGENYVDSGVKILIAIVIGGLLLALLYSLFGDTIMPTVTARVEEMFNYAG